MNFFTVRNIFTQRCRYFFSSDEAHNSVVWNVHLDYLEDFFLAIFY